MVAFIQLTVAGLDSGPFNLYSDVDGFTVAFGPSLSASVLLAGYTSNDVPNGTTIIRVVSTGACKNYLDIPLELPDPISCGASVNLNIVGGFGTVEDNIIQMYPQGGVISVIAAALTNSVKFEILHAGVKKATSAMTGLNGGPFDNVWGMYPGYTIPTNVDVAAVDQFIDTGKGAIPNRNATYLAETGINYISAGADAQMVWWVYTPADYINSQNVILRVTTSTTASFSATNMCETTTTTTTAIPGQFTYLLSAPFANSSLACATLAYPNTVKSYDGPILIGSTVFQVDGVTPFVGGSSWYKISPDENTALQINNSGVVIAAFICS